MGRELQKKKNRSSVSKVRQKPKSKKRVNPRSNPIIAANWDQSQTLVQNYKRLGLLSKLNGRSGGSEKTSATTKDGAHHDALALNTPARTSKTLQPTETKVERDPETGAILRIIEAPSTKPNPLNDPLNDLSDDEEDEFHGIADKHVKSDVVKALEESATMEIKLRPRQQSAREEEWIADLVNKYGDDYGKMARDMKLNPYQQTTGDISRRVKQWKKKQNKV